MNNSARATTPGRQRTKLRRGLHFFGRPLRRKAMGKKKAGKKGKGGNSASEGADLRMRHLAHGRIGRGSTRGQVLVRQKLVGRKKKGSRCRSRLERANEKGARNEAVAAPRKVLRPPRQEGLRVNSVTQRMPEDRIMEDSLATRSIQELRRRS